MHESGKCSKIHFPRHLRKRTHRTGSGFRFSVQLDPTVEELADIRTAVSEAVTNAIVHGYRNSRGDVELHMKLLEDREVYLRIKDHGCGIADITQAMQPLFTTAPEEERAGLGLCGHGKLHGQAASQKCTGKGNDCDYAEKAGEPAMSG